jgi:hypothetical protein
VLQHHATEIFKSGGPLAFVVPRHPVWRYSARQPFLDASLQRVEALFALRLRAVGRVVLAIERRNLCRHIGVGQRLPEIKETAWLLLRVGQHTKLDFQVCHAAPGYISGKPFARFFRRRLDAVCRRHPAVAVAKQHDQKWPAAPHFIETHFEYMQFAYGLVWLRRGRDTDAQIDPFEVVPARAQPLFQLREHAGAQIVALRLHVGKSARDEYRPRLPHRQPRCPEFDC